MSHAQDAADRPPVYDVRLGDRGRFVLPAAVRSRWRVSAGDRLLVWLGEDGDVHIASASAVARRSRGMFADLAPGRSLADELIAERQAEAAREPLH